MGCGSSKPQADGAQQQAQHQPVVYASAPGYAPQQPQVIYVQQATQPLNKDREPLLLLDTTGSMLEKSAANDPQLRRDTVCEALRLLVPQLGEHDSAAQDEEEGGGLRTVTFASGHAHDIGDLNISNLQEKFDAIKWGGGTYLMPGWRKLFEVYNDEFGSKPLAARPLALVCILTDGEADDLDEFSVAIANLPPFVYVAIGIVGYGREHEQALRSFLSVTKSQPRLRIIQLDSRGSNSAALADALVKMFRAPVSAQGWM